eukprot:UN29816
MIISDWVKFMVVLGTFGTTIGIFDCVNDVLTEFLSVNKFWSTLVACSIIYFVCLYQNIANIAFSSYISLIGVIIMLLFSIMNVCFIPYGKTSDFHLVKLNNVIDIISAISIVVFQYFWHFNHVAVHNSLKVRGDMNITIIAIW